MSVSARCLPSPFDCCSDDEISSGSAIWRGLRERSGPVECWCDYLYFVSNVFFEMSVCWFVLVGFCFVLEFVLPLPFHSLWSFSDRLCGFPPFFRRWIQYGSPLRADHERRI